MTYLSVIIPTRNRALFVKDALDSILKQTLSTGEFEILIIDNGSTDATAEVVKEFMAKSNQISYYFAPEPGLHVGRHVGTREAKGEILVFIDDDVIATPKWLEAIKNTFNNPKVGLVGGKILPKWEGDIPDWINLFKSETEYGWTIGYLSLLDFGDVLKEIPAYYVYGCNFSIRKSVLYECGGFHPDSMPQELIRYRGDGETALSLAIMEKGYKAIYEPKATVYHRIPPERLTLDYFCRRAFNQGISDSYSYIRKHLKNPSPLSRRFQREIATFKNYLSNLVLPNPYKAIRHEVHKAYKKGYAYHKAEVKADPTLLAYVLKENYL